MNNMVKVLLKKGLISDLAKVPHSLDLSSPRMSSTVNAALKPLETLSRIVNQPQAVPSKITKHRNNALDSNDQRPGKSQVLGCFYQF